jgi:hypothetical protein
MHKGCQRDRINQEIFQKIWKQSYEKKTLEYYQPNDMAEISNMFCTYRKRSKVKTTINTH